MIRRISTKWVLAVLAAVVVPFLGFAWYVDLKVADRISNDIVRYYLLRYAADLADRIDDELAERRLDVELLASDPIVHFSVGESSDVYVQLLEPNLDRIVRRSPGFDLLLVVDAQGNFVGSSSALRDGGMRDREGAARLRATEFAALDWFQTAAAGEPWLVDHHVSPLLHARELEAGSLDRSLPSNYGIGIAEPIRGRDDPTIILGVVYGVLNWNVFQVDLLDDYRKVQAFEGIGSEVHSSSYSWLWKSDANTIIGHLRTELYGKQVDKEPINLPQLVAAARSSDLGMYPEYEFLGQRKQAAYKHCLSRADGGLGWVVGLGIDNVDIYATVNELTDLLIRATVVVLGLALVWTVFMARRTTRPILALQQHTQRVAAGDLDARIPVESHDELGQLAEAFNQMTAELAENRQRLVKAEKETAWSEMARQVAHEIKNPLTPISLSVNLLRRARDEESPEFEQILERTLGLIDRQVENLRQIAQNFYAFAGERALEPTDADLRQLVDEVLELNTAWAEELGVEVRVEGDGVRARLDPTEFRRVLINLVSNALQSMPGGGKLDVSVLGDEASVRVEVRDTGTGVDEEVRKHLFEPYFTTRSYGTGLGLAICKRVIDEMGGQIRLEPVPAAAGGGTRAVIVLPRTPGAQLRAPRARS